jgi:hypothetical protein
MAGASAGGAAATTETGGHSAGFAQVPSVSQAFGDQPNRERTSEASEVGGEGSREAKTRRAERG